MRTDPVADTSATRGSSPGDVNALTAVVNSYLREQMRSGAEPAQPQTSLPAVRYAR
jgi:hypothetical protein